MGQNRYYSMLAANNLDFLSNLLESCHMVSLSHLQYPEGEGSNALRFRTVNSTIAV